MAAGDATGRNALASIVIDKILNLYRTTKIGEDLLGVESGVGLRMGRKLCDNYAELKEGNCSYV